MDVKGHVCQCYLRLLGQAPSGGLHLGLQGPPAPPAPSAGHPATLQWWLSLVVSSHESKTIGGSQATADLRTASASGPQALPGCRSTNHGAGRRPEGSQATWSKAGALARSSSTFPVAVGPGRTGTSTGVGRVSLSSSGQPPIFAHQPLPVSSEYHSPDSGWWPLLASSPRALCCAFLPQSTSASRS